MGNMALTIQYSQYSSLSQDFCLLFVLYNIGRLKISLEKTKMYESNRSQFLSLYNMFKSANNALSWTKYTRYIRYRFWITYWIVLNIAVKRIKPDIKGAVQRKEAWDWFLGFRSNLMFYLHGEPPNCSFYTRDNKT
jgi:hypothetical protein